MKMNRFGFKLDYKIILVSIPFIVILGLSRHARTVVDVPRKVFILPSPIYVCMSSLAPSRPWKTHEVISSKRLYATYQNIIRWVLMMK